MGERPKNCKATFAQALSNFLRIAARSTTPIPNKLKLLGSGTGVMLAVAVTVPNWGEKRSPLLPLTANTPVP